MQRERIILEYVQDKDVLDIGSVGQDVEMFTGEIEAVAENASQKLYLWKLMKERARSLVGIDPSAAPESGILAGNMESHDLGRRFDVIVAGDVIEHVDNQGLFLRNVREHLKDDGRLIITTPNAKWPTVFLRPNATHALWHDKYTLGEILERYGFQIELFRFYCGNKPYYNPLVRVLAWRQAMLAVCHKQQELRQPRSPDPSR